MQASSETPERHDDRAAPIAAVNLSAQYDGFPAIEGINFELRHGSRAAVVGPNGAGKTTLFKIIAGILKPSGGAIYVHGHQPGRHTCVAYLPQRSQVDWEFPVSVGDVVMMGRVREMGLFRWPRRADRNKVQAALEAVDMADLSNRQIGELSGGQQQRAFLARAVAQEARLVLLDEPLSGLDLPSQEAILEIMDKLRSFGVTLLVATHDLELANERFDHVLLLNRRLVASGPPGEALNRQTLAEAYAGQLHEIKGDGGPRLLIERRQDDPEKRS